jgi:hypothetical protein
MNDSDSLITAIMALILGLVVGGVMVSYGYKEQAIERGFAHRVMDGNKKGTHFEWKQISTNTLTVTTE